MMLKNKMHNWLNFYTYRGTKKSESKLFYPVQILFYFTIQKVKYLWYNEFKERMVSSFYYSPFICFSTIEFILVNTFYLLIDFLDENRIALRVFYFKKRLFRSWFLMLKSLFHKNRYSKWILTIMVQNNSNNKWKLWTCFF